MLLKFIEINSGKKTKQLKCFCAQKNVGLQNYYLTNGGRKWGKREIKKINPIFSCTLSLVGNFRCLIYNALKISIQSLAI